MILRCLKAISVKELGAIRVLKYKSTTMGHLAQKDNLNRYQVTQAYNIMYITSMKYSLPSTSLSIKTIAYIKCFAVDKFLYIMGRDCSMQHDLICGPLWRFCNTAPEMLGIKLDYIISRILHGKFFAKPICININILQNDYRVRNSYYGVISHLERSMVAKAIWRT
jgi:hypothetical protein